MPDYLGKINDGTLGENPDALSSDGCSRTARRGDVPRLSKVACFRARRKTSRRGLRRLVIGVVRWRARILARRRGLVAPGGDFFPRSETVYKAPGPCDPGAFFHTQSNRRREKEWMQTL